MGGAFEYVVNDIDRRKQAEESKERAMVRMALGNFADRPARHGTLDALGLPAENVA